MIISALLWTDFLWADEETALQFKRFIIFSVSFVFTQSCALETGVMALNDALHSFKQGFETDPCKHSSRLKRLHGTGQIFIRHLYAFVAG